MSGDRPRQGSAVTLCDVARRADVHPGTVSRALNVETRALVNEETARRVIEAAEELGYKPNPIARGLKTNRSYTVGVLIPDLTNPLFPPIVRGIKKWMPCRTRGGGLRPSKSRRPPCCNRLRSPC